ncbi:MAG: SMC family ATPase [Actinobacteria bacterium]|nr:SMC family ATPase [Actinomycetota bacterium]
MRPVQIEMSGFRSHEQKTVINFENRSFIAIVGPTGSGKSSVLDAISFALYGKTPRVKNKTKRLICSRTDAAHVKLLFEVEGKRYEVTRVLRNSGGSEHLLLDRDSEERTTGDTAVSERIEELLGLDFDAFCSSVLLAQGRFSQFLEAAPTKQMQILKGVFRVDQLDELRAAAKGKAAQFELELRGVDGALSGIPKDVAGLIKEQKDSLKGFEASLKALAAALPKEKELIKAAERATEDKAAAEKELRSAEGAHASLPQASTLTKLAGEESSLAGEVDASEQAFAAATQTAESSAAALAVLEKDMGTVQVLSELRVSAVTRGTLAERLAGLIAERDAAGDASERLRTEAADLATLAGEAKAAHGDAVAALRDLERKHQAHALRAVLKAGEPCPVCEQTVTALPSTKSPGALTAATKAEAAAATAAERAITVTSTAERGLATAEAALLQAAKRVDEETKALAALEVELSKALGPVDDPLAAVTGRLASLSGAAEEATAAVKLLDETRKEHDSTLGKKTLLGTRRQELCGELIHVAGRIGVAPPKLDDDATSLCAQADEIRSQLSALVEAVSLKAAKAEGAATSAAEELARLRASFDLDDGMSLAEAHADVKTDIATTKQQIDRFEEMKTRSTELIATRKELEGQQSLYATLAEDLTDRHFIKFLLEDRRRLLSELGSAHLRNLTERYRFDDDAEFNVIDELDADKLREIETLSGGELFLASLALSLGLAEAVARHGGRLQCFFLDEGFGSLDPEALGHALDGIEKIVTPERLIGLVSHVAELAERIEDKIVLERSPEGMTLISSDA